MNMIHGNDEIMPFEEYRTDPYIKTVAGNCTPALREELIMAYIVSISAVVLALGVMQERCGSGHVEADLGSDRYGQDRAA